MQNKVLRSIKDNITAEVLLGEISDIICLPMYADRIKHDLAQMNASRKHDLAHPNASRRR